jgi:hypothetical protein
MALKGLMQPSTANGGLHGTSNWSGPIVLPLSCPASFTTSGRCLRRRKLSLPGALRQLWARRRDQDSLNLATHIYASLGLLSGARIYHLEWASDGVPYILLVVCGQ